MHARYALLSAGYLGCELGRMNEKPLTVAETARMGHDVRAQQGRATEVGREGWLAGKACVALELL